MDVSKITQIIQEFNFWQVGGLNFSQVMKKEHVLFSAYVRPDGLLLRAATYRNGIQYTLNKLIDIVLLEQCACGPEELIRMELRKLQQRISRDTP